MKHQSGAQEDGSIPSEYDEDQQGIRTYGKLYCRAHPELSISIHRNGGGGRFCVVQYVDGKRKRATGNRRDIESIAEHRLVEMHWEAGFGDLDRKFGIIRSFPTERTSHGGGRRYVGRSPFKEFGPPINPRGMSEEYAQVFLWLLRTPIRAEWKLVYAFMANVARTTGVFGGPQTNGNDHGPEFIAASVGLTRRGVQNALAGLEEYRLISKMNTRRGKANRYQFHHHEWMRTSERRALVTSDLPAPTQFTSERRALVEGTTCATTSERRALQEEGKKRPKNDSLSGTDAQDSTGERGKDAVMAQLYKLERPRE